MRRILWFRRDLRVYDNPLLSFGGEVLPIFIFDANILSQLKSDDKRVSIIFDMVIDLKNELKKIGLDLRVYFGDAVSILHSLSKLGFDEVIASGDYDEYAKERDRKVSEKIHFRYLNDTYIFKPKEVLKDDKTPYLVFTPFYKKALHVMLNKDIDEKIGAKHSLYDFDYEGILKDENGELIKLPFELKNIGFESFHYETEPLHVKLRLLERKLQNYKNNRDFLAQNATSDLRAPLITPLGVS
jgi:deoxyribodipyrimidine photo-lyase